MEFYVVSVCIDCHNELFSCEPNDHYVFYNMTEEEQAKIQIAVRTFTDQYQCSPINRQSEFSWQTCECCNSKLGGTRYSVIATHKGDFKPTKSP